MGLTVTEKEHWKTRIEAKIDKKIAEVIDRNPQLIAEIQKQARHEAIAALDIVEEHQAVEVLKEQIADLEKAKEEKFSKLCEKLDITERGYYYGSSSVESTIRQRASRIETQLLADHDIGKEIVQLQRERENLLDTVWLATSPRQIRDLWNEFSVFLNASNTGVQESILHSETVNELN